MCVGVGGGLAGGVSLVNYKKKVVGGDGTGSSILVMCPQ